jgi:hypothetical protein
MDKVFIVVYLLAFLANAAASIFWGLRAKRAHEDLIRIKDELVRVKDSQLEAVREFTSAKVLEHHQATKKMLEEALSVKEEELRALRDDHVSRKELVEKFAAMRDQIEIELHEQQEELQKQVKAIEEGWAAPLIKMHGRGTVHPSIASSVTNSAADPTYMVEAEKRKDKT